MLEAVQFVILSSQRSGHLTQAQQTWLLLQRPSTYLSVSIQLWPGYTELFLHVLLGSPTSVLLSPTQFLIPLTFCSECVHSAPTLHPCLFPPGQHWDTGMDGSLCLRGDSDESCCPG